MKFKRALAVFIAALVTASAAGCAKKEVSDEENTQESYTPVETEEVTLSSISKNLSYQGYVKANQTVNVTSKLSGTVEKVYFDVGDYVNKGEVLFTIDKKDINDNIATLQANLKVTEQSVASARTGLSQASSGGQLQTNRLQLENAVKSAKINVESSETALKNSQTTIDNAVASAENAQSSIESAQVAVDNADTAIASAEKALENAKIKLKDAEMAFETTEKTYNNNKTLYEAGLISKNDFDQLTLSYNSSSNAVAQARNGVETAEAAVLQAQNGKVQAEKSKSQAENSKVQAENSVVQAENAKVQAQKSLENAQNALKQAQDNLRIFENSTSKDSVNNAQNTVNTAVANREALQTQLNIAKSNLADTVVKAPISGFITSKSIEPTNMVSAQSVPFVITDVNTVTVEVNVSEKIINSIVQGDVVDVEIEALTDKNIKGVVKTVNQVADATNTYPVKIEISNPDGEIKAGMFAKVYFVELNDDNAVVLSVDTVLTSGDTSYVYTVSEDSRAVKTIVETGFDNGTYVQITNGLKEGDTVIVNGQNYVDDGSLIKVISDEYSEENTEEASSEQSSQPNSDENETSVSANDE